MRAICLSLSGLLLCVAAALAQPGAAPPNVDPPLETTLGGWEKAMSELTSFAAKCSRTTVDKQINAAELFEGNALFLKGIGKQRSRAYLKLESKRRKEIFEQYICSDAFLYEFNPANKVIRVHDLPPAKQGQIGDENFLQFLFGMKAADAKQRYEMSYVPSRDPEQAKWYHFLTIQPKLATDKADFSKAQLVLSAGTYLPRRLWYLQPNGNEITWDFAEVQKNVNIPLEYFQVREVPTGWKMQRVDARNLQPATPPPTVVRPQSR